MNTTLPAGRCAPTALATLLNVDDVGMLQCINGAAKYILGSGIVRSASVMAPGAWVADFATWMLVSGLDVDIGAHLTLTSEWEGCRLRPLTGTSAPTLIDARGYLHRTVEEMAVRASMVDVRAELTAQIQHLRTLGLPPTHLDTHMLFYEGAPWLLEVVLDLAAEQGLPVLLYGASWLAAARSRGIVCPDSGTLDNYDFPVGGRSEAYARLFAAQSGGERFALALHPAVSTTELESCMGPLHAARRVEELAWLDQDPFPVPGTVLRPRDLWKDA